MSLHRNKDVQNLSRDTQTMVRNLVKQGQYLRPVGKVRTATFQAGSLGLLLVETAGRVVVTGFDEVNPDGSLGQAEASGNILIGDQIVMVAGISCEGLTLAETCRCISHAIRPVQLGFQGLEFERATMADDPTVVHSNVFEEDASAQEPLFESSGSGASFPTTARDGMRMAHNDNSPRMAHNNNSPRMAHNNNSPKMAHNNNPMSHNTNDQPPLSRHVSSFEEGSAPTNTHILRLDSIEEYEQYARSLVPVSKPYFVQLDRGQLGMKIVIVDRMILVSGFDKQKDGSPSQAERLGKISVGDQLLSLAGTDLRGRHVRQVADIINRSERPALFEFVPMGVSVKSTHRLYQRMKERKEASAKRAMTQNHASRKGVLGEKTSSAMNTNQSALRCTSCSAPGKVGAKFCWKCGTKMLPKEQPQQGDNENTTPTADLLSLYNSHDDGGNPAVSDSAIEEALLELTFD